MSIHIQIQNRYRAFGLFSEITQKGSSFLCVGFLGGRGHKCTGVHEECMRKCQKEGCVGPWVNASQSGHLSGNHPVIWKWSWTPRWERVGQLGAFGVPNHLKLSSHCECMVRSTRKQAPTPPPCPIFSISKKHKQNGRKEKAQWVKC